MNRALSTASATREVLESLENVSLTEDFRIAQLSSAGIVLECGSVRQSYQIPSLEKRSDWPGFRDSVELVCMNLGCHPDQIRAMQDNSLLRSERDHLLFKILTTVLAESSMRECLLPPLLGTTEDYLAGVGAWENLNAWYGNRTIEAKLELYFDFMNNLRELKRESLDSRVFARSITRMKKLSAQFQETETSLDEFIMLGFMFAIDSHNSDSLNLQDLKTLPNLEWTEFQRLAREMMLSERRPKPAVTTGKLEQPQRSDEPIAETTVSCPLGYSHSDHTPYARDNLNRVLDFDITSVSPKRKQDEPGLLSSNKRLCIRDPLLGQEMISREKQLAEEACESA